MTLSTKYCFLLFLFLLLISLSNTVNAQPGCDVVITLRTQADVDNFSLPIDAPPGVLEGGLVIAPEAANGTTDITNLDGLSSLTQVHGTLLIERNPLLTDISGLSNLTTIGGGTCAFQELVIRQNPLIESLDGLQNVTGFVSRLFIQDAPLVTNLNELTNVTGSDFLWIGGMSGITNVDPLSNMTTLSGLFLTGNTNLLNIDGLAGVSGPFTGGQDFISNNPMLQNLNGLAGVTKTNILTVRNCDALVDLSGLGGITEVDDQLSINNNPGLTSMDGLNPVLVIDGRLTIVGNTSLSDCAVVAVCNHLAGNGLNFITSNTAGCANTNEVINSCNVLPVTIKSFAAQPTNKAVIATWQSDLEENTESYALERSSDGGGTFRLVGTIPAQNNPSGAVYEYTDEAAASQNAKRLYYRLRAQDFDGTTQLFGPITVEIPSFAPNALKVFPNPLRSGQMLNIVGAAAGAKLELRAMDGRLLATLLPNAGGAYTLPEMTAGVYTIRKLNATGVGQAGRFVVR